MEKFVSVIIPVLNNIEGLSKTLAALEQQTYPSNLYEVIVIDNGSTEDLAPVISQFSQAKLTYEPQPGSYIARNQGIRIAQGEIIAFTDSDCIPEPSWLTNGVAQLNLHPNCGLVAGKINFFYQNPTQPTSIELYDTVTFLNQKRYIEDHQYGATANIFTWKKVIDVVGHFNPELKSGGDKEWGKRVASQGYSLVYSPDSCIAHPARYSLTEILPKIARTRIGGYQVEQLSANDKLAFYWQQLVTILWRLKPPTRTVAQKFSLLHYPLNQLQKIKLLWIIMLIHYRGIWIDLKTYCQSLKYIF